jgi:hypothetical protein
MCAGLRMSTEAGDLGEVEAKLALKPVYGVA